jgi:hypothetical protein
MSDVDGFTERAQVSPAPRRITDTVVMRHEHVYEVDPALMRRHVQQQDIPKWDTLRMVDARLEYLHWVQDHWADERISGEELLAEIEAEEASQA